MKAPEQLDLPANGVPVYWPERIRNAPVLTVKAGPARKPKPKTANQPSKRARNIARQGAKR